MKAKRPASVANGRLRWEGMQKEERSAVMTAAVQARWAKAGVKERITAAQIMNEGRRAKKLAQKNNSIQAN